ncbi:armadillo-type protein [Gorgonomyces haynaldii]|nr:armadillo-type protein [Gorgonomyces haynaldii]
MSFTEPVHKGPLSFKEAPKPRRRLKDNEQDKVDGLTVLIQKTKAISIVKEEVVLNIGQDEEPAYHALHSRDAKSQLEGLQYFRKYVCGEGSEERAERVIQWGILNTLAWFLTHDTPEALIFETLWIITNIAAGPTNHTTSIVEAGFLPLLQTMLSHKEGTIRTQAAWAIGNVVGDREGFRDIVLQNGILHPLLRIWEGPGFRDESARKEAFRIAMWVVDNMCRYKPNWHEMSPVFEMLPQVLQQDDPYLLKECCWALARILHQSGRHPVMDSMITEHLCTRLVHILSQDNMITNHPILRALINLSSSSNVSHVKYIVDAHVIPQLEYILMDSHLPKNIRSSLHVFSVQILGNIAANKEFLHLVLESQRLVKCLLISLRRAEDQPLKVEICMWLRNCLFHQQEEWTTLLLENGAVEALLGFMRGTDPRAKVQMAGIDAIKYLKQHKKAELVDEELKKHGAFDVLFSIMFKNFNESWDHVDTLDESDEESEEEYVPMPVSAYNLSTQSQPTVSISSEYKTRIAHRAKQVLEQHFAEDYQKAMIQFYQSQEMMNAMDSMSFGNHPVDDLCSRLSSSVRVMPQPDSAVDLK